MIVHTSKTITVITAPKMRQSAEASSVHLLIVDSSILPISNGKITIKNLSKEIKKMAKKEAYEAAVANIKMARQIRWSIVFTPPKSATKLTINGKTTGTWHKVSNRISQLQSFDKEL